MHWATSPLIEPLWRTQFAALDLMRRAQGQALGAPGFDPSELPYRVVATGDHWRLRDYAGSDTSASLLIVAAPIKRPYIWDLAPTVSAIRYCVLHVYLVEWTVPAQIKGSVGLDECVSAIAECAVRVASQSNGTKPFLIGHSLGGTLAAVLAAYDPDAIRGLLLLGAPLCFQPAASRFRDALVSIVLPDLTDNGMVPGSLLSHASALASPDTFVWSRLLDAARSVGDPRALDVHTRVERWALVADQFVATVPGRTNVTFDLIQRQCSRAGMRLPEPVQDLLSQLRECLRRLPCHDSTIGLLLDEALRQFVAGRSGHGSRPWTLAMFARQQNTAASAFCQTRLLGPGSCDQSRPRSLQARLTMRGSSASRGSLSFDYRDGPSP
jgi:pimeloyl-ACP methyl ester carboxylesterase